MRISVESLESKTIEQDCAVKKEAVGIDFGTTYCVVGFASSPTQVEVLSTSYGTLIPSKVISQEGYTIQSVKRKLAHTSLKSAQASTYFHAAIQLFKVIAQHIREALGRMISCAVITVPAYFDDLQRSQVHKAAQSAGFEVLRLVSEPTAAAIMYGLSESSEGKYLVYDWGGGTFDVSILDIQDGVFKVLATGGDTALGGDDLDVCIAKNIAPFFWDVPSSSQQEYWIKKARYIKESLSVSPTNPIIDSNVTLQDIETWCFPWFQRTLEICEDTLARAKLKHNDIQKIVLVGGSTRIPFVFNHLSRIWDKRVACVLHPEYAVAQGAALQAYHLTRTCSFLLLDVSPLTLGLEVLGGLVETLIPRNTPLPCVCTYTFTTAADDQTKIPLHIVQGEKEFAENCTSLGVFELSGIKPLPKGVPRIELTCSLTVDGLLELEAKELQEKEDGAKASLHINTIKTLDDSHIKKELDSLSIDDGIDVLRRIWTQKHQQASDALEQMKKIIHQYPYLFSEEEQSNISQICQTFYNFLKDSPQSMPQAVQEISERWDEFSAYILPYIERHLTHMFKKTLENP
ncbi:Hsp70 family protein [Holospora curviuscula]|uniref:Chaperone protein HscA n=1 Tax=Holospora curviuscula TaxID=1082868 RepID=A0A2S5R832_9PROT|nr:Hsp70 family protein [Holospora curviuscula]PPE03342.1 Chaperone protein HscA [Holospora curviuscula]